MCRYAVGVAFITEMISAADQAGLLDPNILSQYYDRVLEELDQELFETECTLTVAMERVRRRRLEVQYRTLMPSRRVADSRGPGPRDAEYDVDDASGKRRRPGGGGGGGISKRPAKAIGSSEKQLCFKWARHEVDASAPSCAERNCTYRHSFRSADETMKQRRRYGK